MGTLTPLKDRIDRKNNVIELRKQPRWLERRLQRAVESGESPWVAVKDTSQWRPDPAA